MDPSPSSPRRPTSDAGHPGLDGQPVAEISESMRSLALRLVGDAATADDLVQDAWVEVMRGDSAGVSMARMRGYLRNLVKRHHRLRTRRDQVEQMVATSASVDHDAARLELASVADLLRRTVIELREPYGSVIRSRFLEERSVREIARALGRPEETVKSQVSRGLHELRRALDRKHHGERGAWIAALVELARADAAKPAKLASVGTLAVAFLALSGALVLWMTWGGAAETADGPVLAAGGRARSPSSPDRGGGALAATRRTVASEPAEVPSVLAAVPATGAPAATRRLELVVRDAGGARAARAWAEAWIVDGTALGEFETTDGEIAIEVPEALLVERSAGTGSPDAVMVAARPDGGAWSFQYVFELPAEGRSFEVPYRGPGQSLRGIVRDLDGEPIAGAELVVEAESVTSHALPGGVRYVDLRLGTTTDTEGRYLILGLPLRQHEVRVTAPGRIPEYLVSELEGAEVERDFVLSHSRALRGVVRLAGGRPAAGARVWSPEPGVPNPSDPPPETTAGAGGEFELRGLPLGERWVFAASADGDEDASSILEVRPDADTVWDVELASAEPVLVRVVDPDDALDENTRVLVQAETGPLRWAAVRTPDSNGRARFDHVVDGDLGLFVLRDLRSPRADAVRTGVRASQEELVIALDPVLPTTSGFAGTLLDRGGEPFESAVLYGYCATPPFHQFTFPVDASTGAFHAAELSPLTYVLYVIVDDFGIIELGERTPAEGAIQDLGTVVPEPRRTVSLDWGTVDTDGKVWLLYAGTRASPFRPRDFGTVQPGTPTLELPPGPYHVAELETGTVISFVVSAGADAEVRIER